MPKPYDFRAEWCALDDEAPLAGEPVLVYCPRMPEHVYNVCSFDGVGHWRIVGNYKTLLWFQARASDCWTYLPDVPDD